MSLRDEFLTNAGPYSAPGLIFCAPDPLGPTKTYVTNGFGDYFAFDRPDTGYKTRRIDISGFAPTLIDLRWPFLLNQIPLNGFLFTPPGSGPFPVVVMAHGNADVLINSCRGFIYLGSQMASHGFIGLTIDCGVTNGTTSADMPARAILILEHLKQLRTWNATAGHPLEGKVDLSRVLLMGHSRGGEAAALASLLNPLTSFQPFPPGGGKIALDGTGGIGPYNFGIKGVLAYAPTDFNDAMPPVASVDPEVSYLVVQGSLDFDVGYGARFPGHRTYDRALPIDLKSPTTDTAGFKGLIWMINGCHAYFNEVWPLDSLFPTGLPEYAAILRDASANYFLALACTTGFAHATLNGRTDLLPLIPPYRLEMPYPSGNKGSVDTTSQYQGPHRVLIEHSEEVKTLPGTPVVSSPVTGTITATDVTAQVIDFDDSAAGGFLQQRTQGVQLTWTDLGKVPRYEIDLTGGPADFTAWPVLQFRAGAGLPTTSTDGLHYSLEFSDGTNVARYWAQSFMPTPFITQQPSGQGKMVMQTIRVPLAILDLATPKVDRSKLTTIALVFNGDTSGTLYLDDLQLTM